MAKFQMKERILTNAKSARLAEGTDAANATRATQVTNNHGQEEVGKFVKTNGESRFSLAAAGDQIEGFITSLEAAQVDGYTFGSVAGSVGDYKEVMFDGLQATPGTGTLVVGDRVVVGSVSAKGTALPGAVKVCKATTQTGMDYVWRVVSLGSAGTGAVGTVGTIERVS
ncbi:hypothetical protein [Ferribacterium limneticum]|uniref:hypothetical protein n=1 Tax=Ferribacterium limneticum TaxID=76259 RepID=UPI001CF89F14|nr:hypothetical protein [Ferribacterium limneticum]UCV26793.1 hypothetical protein KI617_10770 [Ferribacterium limneticum]UCV30710.1 hypothetical protein KI608_10770 [Ferribacterium limneticum]